MSKRNNSSKNGSSSSKFIFWMVGLVAVVLIGFIFLGNHQSKQNAVSKGTIDYSHEPYVGKSSAPVSIIEFGDYKCPNCKNFNEKVIPKIKQDLVDSGKAKLYFINDSFIYADSTRAAKFAESVYAVLGNKTFWKFHDLLYEKQPADSKYEKMDFYSEAFLKDLLKQIANEKDVDKVVQYFEAKKSDAAWQKDMDLANKLNVSGTPTIFVNGKLFDGKTVGDLSDMVDAAIKEKNK